MGKAVVFEIALDRKSKIYHPGEVVSGQCLIELRREGLKFRKVVVEFHGEAWTSWQETELYTISHKNEEIYFHKETELLGNHGKKSTNATLPQGRHALQFNFKIPPFSLPSSFESRHGHVKYWLKARIDRPWRFDEVTSTELDILDLVDVNCPRLLLPVYGEAQKSLNCLCRGTASPLKVSTWTDRSGYCPGERVTLSTEIKNLPLAQACQTTVSLIQDVVFRSKCGIKKQKRHEHKMMQRKSLSWEVTQLGIPDVPPTMKNCGIISVSYILKVCVTVPHVQESKLNLEIDLPITIGTVPLRKSCGNVNKLISTSELQKLYNGHKSFVTIKQVSVNTSLSLPAIST